MKAGGYRVDVPFRDILSKHVYVPLVSYAVEYAHIMIHPHLPYVENFTMM